MPRSPLPIPARVTPHGGYAFERRTAAQGGCGVHGHPCKHWGVDLAAKPGTGVYAPEAGTVVYSVHAATGDLPRPFRGYGPGVVMVRGRSGAYHLLAHVRDLALGSRLDGAKPMLLAIPVAEGQLLARVSGVRHLHWELRPAALTGGDKALDPVRWAGDHGVALDVRLPDKPDGGDGEVAWLILVMLGLTLFSER